MCAEIFAFCMILISDQFLFVCCIGLIRVDFCFKHSLIQRGLCFGEVRAAPKRSGEVVNYILPTHLVIRTIHKYNACTFRKFGVYTA